MEWVNQKPPGYLSELDDSKRRFTPREIYMAKQNNKRLLEEHLCKILWKGSDF